MIASRTSVLAAVLIGIMLWSGPASAQRASTADPARVAAAKELLEIAGSAKQIDAVLPMMTNQMAGIFIQMAPKHEKEIRDVFSQMMKKFSARKQEMIDQIAVLYAEKFEAAEMQEVARFFRSGVGAKFIATQPELLQRSMVIGQRWGEQIGREIEAEVRQELKKRGIPI